MIRYLWFLIFDSPRILIFQFEILASLVRLLLFIFLVSQILFFLLILTVLTLISHFLSLFRIFFPLVNLLVSQINSFFLKCFDFPIELFDTQSLVCWVIYPLNLAMFELWVLKSGYLKISCSHLRIIFQLLSFFLLPASAFVQHSSNLLTFNFFRFIARSL